MNRRHFIKMTGMSVIAALATQFIAACGGGSSSGGTDSGDSSDIWESYTVSGTSGGVTKTYTVEIDYNHSHSATALRVTTFESATTNNSIQGTSLHTHTFDLTAGNVTTLGSVGGVVTVTASVVESHPHNVRITRTA